VLHKLRFNKRLFARRLSSKRTARGSKGAIFVEYLLLVTLVGFGVIVGLAALRSALVNELLDLANAINAINS
jgi:Flp pilus assembly pilin Flp